MPGDVDVIAKILDYSWVAVAGLIGIVYKSNAKRLDDVTKIATDALSRREFEDYARATLCSRREMKDSVKSLHEGQVKLFESLARIEGKMEK
jgi:hypothetical protein